MPDRGQRVHAVHSGLCGPLPGPCGTIDTPGLGDRGEPEGRGRWASVCRVRRRAGRRWCASSAMWPTRRPGRGRPSVRAGSSSHWPAGTRRPWPAAPGWREVAGVRAGIGPGGDHGVADLRAGEASAGLKAAQAILELAGRRVGWRGWPARSRSPPAPGRAARMAGTPAVGVAGGVGGMRTAHSAAARATSKRASASCAPAAGHDPTGR